MYYFDITILEASPQFAQEKLRGPKQKFCLFPELTCPEGFHSLKLQCIENSERLVHEACQDPAKRTRIVARIFDDLSDELCRVADMAEFVRLAHPDLKMAKAAEGEDNLWCIK